MPELAKSLKGNYWARIAYYLISDAATRIRYRLGDIRTQSGTLHSTLSIEQSVRYVEDVFGDYKRYGNTSRFFGKVAEVGPGDNCGVGLLFLADGCAHVDLVDRYYSARDSHAQALVYEALAERNPRLKLLISNSDLTDETTFPGLARHYGPAAAAESFFRNNRGYDFIVSRAVLEHVYDPLYALRQMAHALNPGGLLLHKVDLRDHGLFSSSHHELKFLEVPSLIYKLMTGGTGRPNRVMFHAYKAFLDDLPVDYTLLITRLTRVGDVEPHIPFDKVPVAQRLAARQYVEAIQQRLSTDFRRIPADDLAVSGFFLVCRRRSA